MATRLSYPSDSAYAEDMYSGGVQRTPQNRAHSHSADHGSPSSSTLPSFASEPVQRKRGKFTRSKTGCLTCRAKKVKCDEEKPDCKRCRDTHRACTWPENVPAKKRPTRRESMRQSGSPGQEMRPSTAGSSSEVSTPPGRMDTPPRQMSAKQPLSLPPHITVGPGTVQAIAPSQRQIPSPSMMSAPNMSSSTRHHMGMDSSHSSQQPYLMYSQSSNAMLSGMPGLPPHQPRHPSLPSMSSQSSRYAPSSHVSSHYPPPQGLSQVTSPNANYGYHHMVKVEEETHVIKHEEDDWASDMISHNASRSRRPDPIPPFITMSGMSEVEAMYAHSYDDRPGWH